MTCTVDTTPGDIYFWQLRQIKKKKTHIRPYVTAVSASQSSTFFFLFFSFFNASQHLLIFPSSLWIMLSILLNDNNASPLNLCSGNLTARETICIFLCRLSAIRLEERGREEGGGGASVGIWYAGVLVGKTMGASGAMCDFSFSFQMAPGVMLCDFFFPPLFLYGKHSRRSPPTAGSANTPLFLIRCHSLAERTNKDDFWQPEKSNRSCQSFSPRKNIEGGKKKGAYTVSSLHTYPLHLANAYAHTHTHTLNHS